MSEEKKTIPEHKYAVTFVSKVGTIMQIFSRFFDFSPKHSYIRNDIILKFQFRHTHLWIKKITQFFNQSFFSDLTSKRKSKEKHIFYFLFK